MRRGRLGRCLLRGEQRERSGGDGTKDYAYEAVKVQGLPAPAVQVEVTLDSTCAVLTSGKVYCWGVITSGNSETGSSEPRASYLRKSLSHEAVQGFVVAVAVVGWSFGLVTLPAACGNDRQTVGKSGTFVDDDAATPSCKAQCSLDGRSTLTVCGDQVMSTETPGGHGVWRRCLSTAVCRRWRSGARTDASSTSRCHGTIRRFASPVCCVRQQYIQSDATVALAYQGKPIDNLEVALPHASGSAEYVPQEGLIHPGEGAILSILRSGSRG